LVAVPSAVKLTVTDVELGAVSDVAVVIADTVLTAVDDAETDEPVLLPDGVTVKVYDVPLARPVTVQFWLPVGGVVVFATVHVKLPGVEVTVYNVAVPSAVKVTFMAPEPAVVATGVARAAVGTTALDAGETVEVSPPPLGVTLKV
jgi:hypothetical protein